jgi:predicted XRE-type DNA-binding protein
MIHLLRKSPTQQFQPFIDKAGLKMNQVGEAIFIAKESIMQILREELKKGNVDEVVNTLKGKPMQAGRKLLIDKIIKSIATKIGLRMGLRGAIATGLAAILVPLILAKMSAKILQSDSLTDLMDTFGITDRMNDLTQLGDTLREKFTFKKPDAETPAPAEHAA